jgi:uncharacterized protein YjdB
MACGGGDDETSSPVVTLKSITVSPAQANVAVGATQQFAVNGVYSDGKTKAVTTGVTWTSSTTTVATINTSGLATAVADGSTTVTATVGKLKGTATLTVITKALTGIQVTPASASIGVGTTQQYAATANYNDGTTTDVTASATWSSSATATATISATGLASGVAAGTSTISATFEAATGTAILTVTDNAMTGIVVTPANASIAAGIEQAYTATAEYADGSTDDITADVTWTSSDTAVATMADETATAVAPGTTTITAAHAASGLSGSTELTVTDAEITELQITPATEDAIVGGPDVEFTATAIYSDGTSDDVTDTATWSSSDDAIATIDAGVATAVAAGTATITAEFDGMTDTAELTVTAPVLDSIVVTPATASIPAGTTQQFTAVGYYNNGTSLDVSTTADWVSSALTVATVDADTGLATGVAAGTSTITATLAGVSGTAELTVTDVVLTSIQITPAVASIADGATQAYSALGTYSDNTTADLTAIASWDSSDDAVATIATTGLATAVAPGTTTITAAYQGITSNSATLVVTNVVVTGISVTCAATTIADGTDTQCTAQATYSDGSNGNVTSLATWTTDDDTIASVNQMGLVSGEGAGTATITATYGGFSGNVDVTVTTATLTAIQVTPAAPSIADGTTQQFVATGTYSDGTTQVITTDVTWTSSNATVATITLGGLATGNAPGQSTITAALSGITGTATLTVTAATVDFLTIAPLTPSIAKGATVQFTAAATFTDGTTQNVTSAAAWTTSAAATATVVGGLATGVEVGTATITATYGGASAGTLLTVTGVVVTSVQVTPATATIADGATQQFTAVALYSDGTNSGTLSTGVTWTSSTGTVATINAAGLATAQAPGSTNIRATYLGVQSDPAVLTVTNAVPTSLAITPATASIADGTTQQFTATVTLSDGTTQNVTSAASWTSSSTATATVVAGLATAVNPGTTTITATYQTLSATASLTVTGATLTGIVITTTDNSIALGTSTSFTATGSYTDGTSQPISHLVTWTQTPTGVLSFGTATAASVPAQGATVGTTVVRANVGAMQSNTLSVTVTAAELVSLAITPAAAQSRYVGQTIQFEAEGTYTDGSTQTLTTDAGLTWTSSVSTVVAISNAADKGLATALMEGTSNIRANVGTIQSNLVAVTVTEAPSLVAITIDPTSWETNVGATTVFSATAHYLDGSSGLLLNGTWTVENVAGDAVNNVSLAAVAGQAHQRTATAVSSTFALSGGRAYVAVASGTIKTRAWVDVNESTVTSVAVSCPPTTCLPTNIGFTVRCTATATYADNSTGDVTSTAVWASSTGGVATVSGGVVSVGATAGSTNVTAAVGTETSTPWLITTASQTLQSLAVNPGTFNLHVGEELQLAANATFLGTGTCAGTRVFDVAHLTSTSWTSSAASVATVSNTGTTRGLVTAVGQGQSAITATFGSLAAISTVTVSSACIESVSIAAIGVNNHVPSYVTAQLTVTAEYNDGNSGTLSPLTAGGTWNNAAVDNNWRLTVNDVDIPNLTYTAANVCTGTETASIDVIVDDTAVLNGLQVVTSDNQTSAQSIPKGGSRAFKAMATYGGGFGTYNVTPFSTWSNSPAIEGLTHAASTALVEPTELYSHTGLIEGTTNIIANYKTFANQPPITLTISGKTVESIEILTGSFTPAPSANGYPGGLTVGTVARVNYSDGSDAINPAGVTWTSSHPTRLSFASTTTPVAQTTTGTTVQAVVLTASITEGTITESDTATVSVNTATISELIFNPASGTTFARGTTTPLAVTGQYNNGDQFDISNQLDSIQNLNGTIAQVLYNTTDGLRIQTSATNSGLATTNLTKSGLSRGYSMNVTGVCITSIAFTIPTANPVSIGLQEEVSFRATATDTAGGTTNVTANGLWSDSNTYLENAGTTGSGATLAQLYRGLAAGETEVVFTYNHASICAGGDPAEQKIEVTRDVNVNADVIESLVIYPRPVATQDRRRLPRGQHLQLSVYARYTDGTQGTTDLAAAAGTTWSINDTGAANPSVTSTGRLFAGSLTGIDEVRATYGGATGTLPIQVFDCGIPEVTISSAASGNLPIGQTRNYTAAATYTASAGCQLAAEEIANLEVTSVATWASSNTARAAFQTAGFPNRVTGLSAGSTDITAVYNGDTSNEINLTVVSVTLQELVISQAAGSTYAGGTVDVTVSATWTDGAATYSLAPPPNLTWLYGTPGAISVAATADPTKYVLTGLEAATGATYNARHVGTTTVTSNTLSMTVQDDCIAEVRIVGADPTQPANTMGKVVFECRLNNETTWDECDAATFVASGDPIFGTIGVDGSYTVLSTATPEAEGIITATQGNGCVGATLSDDLTVTVGDAELTAVNITAGPSTIARNSSGDYVATATFADGTGSGGYNITGLATWSSSNTAIATFSGPGHLVAGNANGSTYITAAYGGITSPVFLVTVNDKIPTALTISASGNRVDGTFAAGVDAEYPRGGWLLQLHATAAYSAGAPDPNPSNVAWTVETGTAGTVSSSGLFTTAATGTTSGDVVVKAVHTYNNVDVQDFFTVRVVYAAGGFTGVTILPTAATSVPQGLTQDYTAQATYGGVAYWFTRNVNWYSSTPTVGTISQSGNAPAQFSALTLGTTLLTAARGTVTGTHNVSVTAAVPVSLYCLPGVLTLQSGSTAQLRAFTRNSAGDDTEVTSSASWTSDNAAVAAFEPLAPVGLITATHSGTAAASTYAYPTYTYLSVPVPIEDADRCEITVPAL